MSTTKGSSMDALRLSAIILIVGGAAGLVYGRFSYPTETHTAIVGDVGISVQEQHTVDVPLWAGAGAVVAGVLMLTAGARRQST